MVGHRGHRIGLEQIGGHAGAIADIVTDIVGDGGGVARIVFGNAASTLPTRSPRYVGALVKMPPPRRAKIGNQGSAEASATAHRPRCGCGSQIQIMGEEGKIDGDAEQRQGPPPACR